MPLAPLIRSRSGKIRPGQMSQQDAIEVQISGFRSKTANTRCIEDLAQVVRVGCWWPSRRRYPAEPFTSRAGILRGQYPQVQIRNRRSSDPKVNRFPVDDRPSTSSGQFRHPDFGVAHGRRSESPSTEPKLP